MWDFVLKIAVPIGAVAAAAFIAWRGRPTPETPGVEPILAALPGGNCGACGNASCFIAAQGIASGRLPADTCVAGGSSTAEAVSAVLRRPAKPDQAS